MSDQPSGIDQTQGHVKVYSRSHFKISIVLAKPFHRVWSSRDLYLHYGAIIDLVHYVPYQLNLCVL